MAENIVPNTFIPGPAASPAAEFPTCSEAVDFDRLYRKYGRRVFLWCGRIVRNDADAEDLAQDSFLQLFRTIHKFRGESSFSTWFHRVAVNVALGHLRRNPIPTLSLDSQAEGDQENPGGAGLMNRRAARTENPLDRVNLERALIQLPSTHRTILVLHDVHGYRHFEIAKILGLPIGTSKSYLHRARRRMRALLASGKAEATGDARRQAPAEHKAVRFPAKCIQEKNPVSSNKLRTEGNLNARGSERKIHSK